jgi:MATE family multidrug resistance protein
MSHQSPFRPTRKTLRELLALALPVVTVQVGLMTMGVADSVMVGHISAAALGGVALGNVYFFAVCVFGMGVLLALDPVVSQAVGARDEPAVARGLQRGIVLSLLLSMPASLLLLATGPFLEALGQPAEVVPIAAGYVLREIPSVFPFYAFVVFRQTLQALGRMRAIVAVIVLSNLINVGLNWVLIFGKLGFPEMGANGSAWATTLSRWAMLAGIVALAWPTVRRYLLPWRPESFDARALGRMVALGAPIGVHMQLEFGVFGTVGLLMGRLGTEAVAAHQIALNLASLTFMVPLGVAGAATVLVGQAIGRDEQAEARRAAGAALLVGLAFMSLAAAAFLLVPRVFASAYSNDPAVLALASILIPIAGVFQVFDGLHVVSAGVLRGVADTRYPMAVGLIGFWLLGLPISLALGFWAGLGPPGLWWGLAAGLAIAAMLLVARVRSRLRREVLRVVIDEDRQTPADGVTASGVHS